MTKQRRVILDELRKLKSHPSADELYRRVRRFLPRISLGTVYRNLEVLSQQGVVQKVELGGPQRRYDGDATTHYHVRCVECGRVEDAPVKGIILAGGLAQAGEFLLKPVQNHLEKNKFKAQING